ncbi:YolD-like family protein [Faecalibacillus intestinalis]|uniref:YolD-like family protein n=1 Tax=Faecalibacillus intestinalis TaxID=1982626 RepID=UPI0022E4D372|nr:YolD-like family protein [Faecalibacillus intestinalis]
MPRTRAQRAQIFQSFDALKGFREILKEQERVLVPKKILSEDDLNELDYKIHQIKVGMIIQIVYYDKNQYIQLEGIVSKINLDTKLIQIVKNKINILNIVNVEIIDSKSY